MRRVIWRIAFVITVKIQMFLEECMERIDFLSVPDIDWGGSFAKTAQSKPIAISDNSLLRRLLEENPTIKKELEKETR